MAQTTTVIVTCDVCGSEDAETTVISLNGAVWELELCANDGDKLNDALTPYLDVARAVKGTKQYPKKTTVPSDAKAIRKWAQSRGLEVPARGRIPNQIVELYEKSK